MWGSRVWYPWPVQVRNRGSRDGTIDDTRNRAIPLPAFFVGPLNHPCRGRDGCVPTQTTAVLLLDDNKLFRWATNAIDLHTLDRHPG